MPPLAAWLCPVPVTLPHLLLLLKSTWPVSVAPDFAETTKQSRQRTLVPEHGGSEKG